MKNALIVLGLALLTLACSDTNDATGGNPTPVTYSYNITCESSDYASSSSNPVSVTWSTSTGLGDTIQCTSAASGLASNISLQSTDVINITVSGNSYGFSKLMESTPGVPGPSALVATVMYPSNSSYVVPY